MWPCEKRKDMQNSNLIARSLLHSLAVLVYVTLVVWLMTNIERLFGEGPAPFWGPLAFLMLFVLSAAIVWLLVFAKPVMMYLDGAKKEAVTLVFSIVAWLALITVLIIAIVFGRS
mgnify:CR=1 FL=1